jgi:SAM-dependent methyltransferase
MDENLVQRVEKLRSDVEYQPLTKVIQDAVAAALTSVDLTSSWLAKDQRLRLVDAHYLDRPVDKFILLNLLFNYRSHFSPHYVDWRMRRINKVLEIYGLDFKDKKILELGGGLGDIGAFFAELGATVVSAEGRVANRNFANLRYRDIPTFKSVPCNLEEDFTDLGRFDLIINFGLLEVVKDVRHVLECCTKMSDKVVLETLVCDSLDPNHVVFRELDTAGRDNPLSGISSQPSPLLIENFFTERGFKVDRYFTADLNTYKHRYDWEHANNGYVDDSIRRFWNFTRESG